MEYSSGSSSPALFSENNIRHFQSEIKSDIENFEKHVSESFHFETFNLCDVVKDKILNYDDEPQLSRVQNNFRRIYIASELIVGICSVYDHVVDFAFTKIINDLLHLDRYKIISRAITKYNSSNWKAEKYFVQEAHTKLLKRLRDNENLGLEEQKKTRRVPALEERTEPGPDERAEAEEQLDHGVNAQKEISLNEIGQILEQDVLADSHEINLVGDMTEVRIEPQTEASNLIAPSGIIPADNITLHPPEISIRDHFDQQPVEEDVNQILQTCDKIPQIDISDSVQSENLLRPMENILEFERPAVEKSPSPIVNIETQIHQEEDLEEWDLSTLEPDELPKKKCAKLRTDKLTVIPNYSIRAVQLNKNIEIQRVQVYEGPPRILQSMSSEYLMKTSGFKSFLSQNVRSSMLEELYSRNLTTEKMPVEPFTMPKVQARGVESRITETGLEVRERPRIEQGPEEVGEIVGMRGAPVESAVLAELVSDKTRPSISVNERDAITGVPVSRIMSPVIGPQDQEKINGLLPVPSPRIQQLQGTTLEPKKHSPPWFFPTEQKPPRAEFREFDYVKSKLAIYWSLFETHGMEKSITVREFLLFEEDGNPGNYFTLLRIVDKLSIQRKLFLVFKDGDVLIKPFATPSVSEDQLLLQGKEQIL